MNRKKDQSLSTQLTRCVNQTPNSKSVMRLGNTGNPDPAKANSKLQVRVTFPHDCKKEQWISLWNACHQDLASQVLDQSPEDQFSRRQLCSARSMSRMMMRELWICHILTWICETAAKEKAALWKLMQRMLYLLHITGGHFFFVGRTQNF